MTDTILRGSMSLNVTSDTLVSDYLTPAIDASKAWLVEKVLFSLNIGNVGNTTSHLTAVIQNKTPVGGKKTEELMQEQSTLVLLPFGAEESTSGTFTGYKTGLIEGIVVPDDVYLDDAFYVSLIANSTSAGASTAVVLAYILYLKEVKINSKIQSEILRSVR